MGSITTKCFLKSSDILQRKMFNKGLVCSKYVKMRRGYVVK